MVSFMKKTLTLITLLFLGVSVLQAQTVTRDPQVFRAPDVPAPKYGSDGKVSATFLAMHERFLSIAKEGKVGLLFLGDSITAGWGSTEDIWYRYFGRYKPANFGVSGDRTQHVLWRIQQGELGGIQPRVIVLMIGTNNTGADSATGIAKGITAIVGTLREKQPKAKILLLGILPRGKKASSNPYRDKINQANDIISRLHDGKRIHYLDIGNHFLLTDGSISAEIMPDYLHPSVAGYKIWADAIAPKLTELMR